MLGLQDYAPKPAVLDGVFVAPGDFVTPGLVGFGPRGISEKNFGTRWDYRIATPKPAVFTGVFVTPGDFVIPGLVGFGS